MPHLTRRGLSTRLATLLASSALSLAALPSGLSTALAQAPQQKPAKFAFEDVQRRARELAAAPYAPAPALPDAIQKLDYEGWRDIRFKPERAALNNSPFRLQAFHLGHVFRRPVTINLIREGIATPIPYAANLFDYGRTKFDKPLPVNLGFAGFRLHYALNDPRVHDEAIAFLGQNAFRLLGRGQRYGLSALGLAVNPGMDNEDIAQFIEFWVEAPEANTERVTFYALLDSESVTGAYRFDFAPGIESVIDVSATLHPRRPIQKLGLAPLSSMFLTGENDRRISGDWRPELHDSDGLLINTGAGEWLWRPLRNPTRQEISSFVDRDVKGFGLLQRDRTFEHYQDLELNYELRPSYWVEPRDNWGEGQIDLIEMPAKDDAQNNVLAAWVPKAPVEVGKPITLSWRITSSLDMRRMSPNGRAIATFQTPPRAFGSSEPVLPGSRRFIVDFAGGELRYFQTQPEAVEVVASTTSGEISRSFVQVNPQTGGFRAVFDVQLAPGQSGDLRAFLRMGSRALTETWTFPWRAE